MTYRRLLLLPPAVALLLLLPRPAESCSLCGPNLKLSSTFREEAASSSVKAIVYGTLANPRLVGINGVTDLQIKDVLRSADFLKGKTVIELPRFLAVTDKANPPKFLIFCDFADGKIDPYRGVPIRSAAGLDYMKKSLALDAKDTTGNLSFYFRHLDDPDQEVALDAFLEFAKSNDEAVVRVAPKLDRAKLRGWIEDSKTGGERIALYAMLLGGCGTKADAAFLRGLLDKNEARFNDAAAGILAGYIHLEQREGWDLTFALLRDSRKPLPLRLGAVSALRFYRGAQPRESKANVLRGLSIVLQQPDLADMAVEDLRQWKVWDLTREVLALYGKRGYDAPIMRNAILRYALTCAPTAESAAFIARCRAADGELVRYVEESLRLERGS